MPRSVSKYYDSRTGFVEPSLVESRLIDSPWFRRLQGVKQLGALSLIFPGATHSRFSHSLGALNEADAFYRSATADGDVTFNDNQRRHVRLAALLHDVGHGPFSHNIEQVFRPEFKRDTTPSEEEVARGVGVKIYAHELYGGLDIPDENRHTHEAVGKAILLHKNGLQRLMTRQARDEVIAILNDRSEPEFLSQIVSGGLDVDKLDYVQRDSAAMGIGLGGLDAKHLISELTVRAGSLAIHEGGLSSLQHLHVARYLMRSGFVLNKNVHCLEALVTKAYAALAKRQIGGRMILPNLREYLTMIHETLENKGDDARPCSFHDFDDSFLISRLRRTQGQLEDTTAEEEDGLTNTSIRWMIEAVTQGKPFPTIAQVDYIQERGTAEAPIDVGPVFDDFSARLKEDYGEQIIDGSILIETRTAPVVKPEALEFPVITRMGGGIKFFGEHHAGFFAHLGSNPGRGHILEFRANRVFAHPSFVDQLLPIWETCIDEYNTNTASSSS